MTKTNVLKCALATLLVAFPLSAPWHATVQQFEARVVQTLVTTDTVEGQENELKFGGCMVALDVSPAAQGLNCPDAGNWVTFSCSGTHTSRSNAMRMLDSAQLAFVSNRRVRVYVDDSRMHNGWCLATRVDVLAD